MTTKPDATLDHGTIALYLERNPDFFIHYPDVLARLQLPAETGGKVTNLHAFQATRLAQQLAKLEDKNRLLIQTSLQNIESQGQIHRLVLRLMAAPTLADLVTVLDAEVKTSMDVDSVTLHLIKAPKNSPVHILDADRMTELFRKQEPALLRTLFDDAGAALHGKAMASDALVRLHHPERGDLGLLALGSTRKERFHAGQATDLLGFLGGVLGYVVGGLLVTPAKAMKQTG
jgi:uncharacterized protein